MTTRLITTEIKAHIKKNNNEITFLGWYGPNPVSATDGNTTTWEFLLNDSAFSATS